MKKWAISCIAGWAILLSMMCLLYSFAKDFVPEIASPKLTAIQEGSDQAVQLEWTAVDYATSYRIFRRENENQDWMLLKVVPSSTLSYIDENSPSHGVQYAVRTCNGSMEHLNLSDYSNILSYFP